MLKNLEICDLLLMRIKSWQITPIWRDQISQFFPKFPNYPDDGNFQIFHGTNLPMKTITIWVNFSKSDS